MFIVISRCVYCYKKTWSWSIFSSVTGQWCADCCRCSLSNAILRFCSVNELWTVSNTTIWSLTAMALVLLLTARASNCLARPHSNACRESTAPNSPNIHTQPLCHTYRNSALIKTLSLIVSILIKANILEQLGTIVPFSVLIYCATLVLHCGKFPLPVSSNNGMCRHKW